MRISNLFMSLVAIAVTSGVALGDMPRNSFLVRPVRDTPSLLNQTRNEAVVMDRYRRHFAMTSQQVLDYFSQLRMERLSHNQVFTVYSVPVDGTLRMHSETLKKGEWIFSDAQGRPALRRICGNPLTLGPVIATALQSNPEVVGVSPDIQPFELAEAMPDGAVALMDPAVPVLPIEPPVIVPPVVDTPGVGPQLIGSSTSPLIPLLVGSLIIPGGSTAPVPEPTGIVALLAGLGAMAARRRKSA